MSPSATPATQSGAAPRATNPDQARHPVPSQNEGGCQVVPRLPRETKVDVRLCHACHAKWRGAPGDKSGPSAPHSTMSATPATQNDGGCEFVPRLPHETKVWTKCVWTKCLVTKCVWTKCVVTKCVWTKCVWTKCLVTKCVWTSVCGQSVCGQSVW